MSGRVLHRTMLIVTLMNYEDPTRILMCKAWLYCLRRIHPDAEVLILHYDKFDAIKEFTNRFENVRYQKTDLADIPSPVEWTARSPESKCSWMDLTISVWRLYERMSLARFIFIEPDAFVIRDLSGLWKAGSEMPFVGVAERERWGDISPYLNLGVYAYNPSGNFLTYEKLFRYWEENERRVPPIGDQGLINGYFKSIGYSPFHPDIGIEYNCLAAGAKIIRFDDVEIDVKSGPRPPIGQTGGEFREYIGWDKNVDVHILHAFGPAWKFWMIPATKPLWEYLKGKVEEIEKG